MNVKTDRNICKVERKVYDLVQMLLEVGDDQLRMLQNQNIMSPLTGLPLSSYEPVRHNKHYKATHIVLHQDQINAVMMAIKPGYFNIYCKKYSNYLIK